jgi:hypothetical protein
MPQMISNPTINRFPPEKRPFKEHNKKQLNQTLKIIPSFVEKKNLTKK